MIGNKIRFARGLINNWEKRIRKEKRQILNEYGKWKSQNTAEEAEEDELC